MFDSNAIRTSLALACVAMLSSACDDADAMKPAVAEPMVRLSTVAAPPGYPIEMTYRFRVLPDTKISRDYHVMVHFADQNDQLLFTDDHDLPVSTNAWKPGQVIEYQRTWFMPATSYAGHVTIELGLYSAGPEPRLRLLGTDVGSRSYAVGALDVTPPNATTGVYRTGWHAVERLPDGTEWYWTKKEGVVEFANPGKDSVLYLMLDNPSDAIQDAQHVTVFAGDTLLDRLTVTPQQPSRLYKIPAPAAAWGGDPLGRIRLAVDKTFVPVQIRKSLGDSRELGVRVLHAVIVPSR